MICNRINAVCWDSFDAEEIWNAGKERRGTGTHTAPPAKSESTGMPVRREREQREQTVRKMSDEGGDRWQRGVALPPAGEGGARRSGRHDSENPDDLWDDPEVATDAAADFSAFGGSLDDAPKGSGGGDDAFDLAMMAEAAQKFDDDFHGEKEGGANSKEIDDNQNRVINPKRPLAAAGTTISTGSGDGVNVFNDFDDTAPESATDAQEPIQAGGDAQSASSRLMQMIGVSSESDKVNGVVDSNTDAEKNADIFGSAFAASSVPSNPWGAPMPAATTQDSGGGGLDLAAKMREVRQAENQHAEIEIMRKREEEEEERRAAILAQQQAELQARQAAMQKQQQQPQQPEYSQVELILTERISTILENSWGRSDLMTVLQTLHNDDSRVVPLLATVDALRALIVRHPRRFALTKDPSFGAEMAVLVMNNAQWQQHQASEDMQRRQQEEHQKMLAAKEAEARAKAEAAARAKAASKPIVITAAPWYYADPQGNIQVCIVDCTLFPVHTLKLENSLTFSLLGSIRRR